MNPVLEVTLKAELSLLRLWAQRKNPVEASWPTLPALTREEAMAHLEGRCGCASCLTDGRPGNLGCRTGHGLAVIDIDCGKSRGPLHAYTAMQLPATWTVKTGGGGWHTYWKTEQPIPNSVGLLAPGIDVRGVGGRAVVPPSLHASGERYAWASGRNPDTIPIATLPDAIAARLLAKEKEAPATDSEGDEDLFSSGKMMVDLSTGPNVLEYVPGASAGRRNKMASSLVGRLLANEIDRNRIWTSLREWNSRCEPPLEEPELRRIFTSMCARDEKRHPERYRDRRPVVIIGNDLTGTVRDVVAALQQAYPVGHPDAIYNQAGTLVRIEPGEPPAIIRLDPGAATVLISHACRLRLAHRRTGATERVPEAIVRGVLGLGVRHFHPLRRIMTRPYLSADGRLLTSTGYDQGTLLMMSRELPASHRAKLEASSTREAAMEAIERLLAVFQDFPTKDRSAILACCLSVAMRATVSGDVPLFAIRSHTPGSGKTLLAKTIAVITLGRNAPVMMPTSSNEDEMRKRIFAMAMGGTPLAILDNVQGELGSNALSAALTGGGQLYDRVLGETRAVNLTWNGTLLVTGNGLSFRADQARRTVLIDLDPDHPNPELRSNFRFPMLLQHVSAHSLSLYLDILTILRAHAANGSPIAKSPPLGGFEEWDARVRQALLWCDMPDPLTSRDRLRVDDADYRDGALLLATWREQFGASWIDEASLFDMLRSGRAGLIGELLPRDRQQLMSQLRRTRGRQFSGLRLESESHQGAVRWRVLVSRLPRPDEQATPEPTQDPSPAESA